MFIPDALYQQILQSMPIVCVDLVVFNELKEILLVKRQNQPLQNQWWVPGGRVLHRELRKEAAIRKLKVECGLEVEKIQELGTYDLILDTDKGYHSHAVSTFFEMRVSQTTLQLDSQSTDFAWKTKEEWLKMKIHPFLEQLFTQLQ